MNQRRIWQSIIIMHLFRSDIASHIRMGIGFGNEKFSTGPIAHHGQLNWAIVHRIIAQSLPSTIPVSLQQLVNIDHVYIYMLSVQASHQSIENKSLWNICSRKKNDMALHQSAADPVAYSLILCVIQCLPMAHMAPVTMLNWFIRTSVRAKRPETMDILRVVMAIYTWYLHTLSFRHIRFNPEMS